MFWWTLFWKGENKYKIIIIIFTFALKTTSATTLISRVGNMPKKGIRDLLLWSGSSFSALFIFIHWRRVVELCTNEKQIIWNRIKICFDFRWIIFYQGWKDDTMKILSTFNINRKKNKKPSLPTTKVYFCCFPY